MQVIRHAEPPKGFNSVKEEGILCYILQIMLGDSFTGFGIDLKILMFKNDN
jgi:hypothetical protein